MQKIAILSVSILAFTGCSSVQPSSSSIYTIQLNSTPQGAEIVCAGRTLGYAPQNIDVPKKAIKELGTVLPLSPCTANWASGAKYSYKNIDPTQFPEGVSAIASRPDMPGLQQDMDFALKVEQMKSQQRIAAATESAAISELMHRNMTTHTSTPYTYTPMFTNCYDAFGGINCIKY